MLGIQMETESLSCSPKFVPWYRFACIAEGECFYLTGPAKESFHFPVPSVEMSFCSLLLWTLHGRTVVKEGGRLGKGDGSIICDPCYRVF